MSTPKAVRRRAHYTGRQTNASEEPPALRLDAEGRNIPHGLGMDNLGHVGKRGGRGGGREGDLAQW